MTTSTGDPATSPDQVSALLREFLSEQEVPWEDGVNDGEFVITLPGERKLRTVVSLTVGARDLRTQAFVIRNPDEQHEQFYRYLLRRNLKLPTLAYAIDGSGDVYVEGRVPLSAVDTAYLDNLLGELLVACDEPFNELLVIGFITSMRREWAWRISRGESTANLEAFRHLLEGADDEGSLDSKA